MVRMMLALALAAAAGAPLAACSSSEDKAAAAYDTKIPLDKMTTEQWCAYYAKFLTNPQLSPQNREVDLQRMRARGCPMPS